MIIRKGKFITYLFPCGNVAKGNYHFKYEGMGVFIDGPASCTPERVSVGPYTHCILPTEFT